MSLVEAMKYEKYLQQKVFNIEKYRYLFPSFCSQLDSQT